MSMERYHELAKEKLSRTCTEHEDQQYSGGCKVCLKLVCAHCAFNPDSCEDGKLAVIYWQLVRLVWFFFSFIDTALTSVM